VLSGGLSACGASSNEIAGNWMPDDGSNVKTISDSGECTGMYYNGSKPLDIGGGMTCEFSKNADGEGMHTMVVSQPPNQETLKLKFVDADVVDVYSGGTTLLTMKRQCPKGLLHDHVTA
jgi:hypothetical protein